MNVEQKKALKHSDGPLLIIAGAGTGKTRVITSRVLELLNSGKAKTGEILAMTFTDKAANEMRERIDVAMPLSYDDICIKTFHSFSEHILREAGMEMGIDQGYKILSQVEQWFFFKKNLFEFELDYYRPLGNPNRFIYAILNHFSKLKDELISPEVYLAYAEKIMAEIRAKQADNEQEFEIDPEEAEKTFEIAKAYKKYQELLLSNNFLDFGDLSYYANELFAKRSSVLKRFLGCYKYIMVDEFQDTNYAQFELILKLAGGHKNIAVVGDDDQSIYKWRGASLSNILQFEKHFPNCEKIVLTENYRSSQNILDAAYSMIQNNNPDRLEIKIGLDKKLLSKAINGDPVEVHHFADFVQESSFVADEIKKIREKTGADWSEFAILVRSNSHTGPFIDELKYLGIPYQVRNPKGLFSLDEIKNLIAVIKVLANPYDDIAMLRVLKMNIFELKMAEILKLLNQGRNEHLFDLIKPESSALPGIEDGKEKVHNILLELIEYSKNQSVGLVINEFLQKSKLLHYLIEKECFEELENINEFAKQISKFEKNSESRSVRDFINYLNLLEEAGANFEGEAFADRDSVQILTVHGSKGLEFDYVFIVNAVGQRFPSTRRSEPFEIPEKLTKEIYPEGDFHLQEERRLFYVAMTRARKKLFINYSDQYEGNKKWKVSPFVSEVLASNKAKEITHAATPDAIEKLRQYREPNKPIFDLPPFKSNRLSYSQFDTFKMCPLKYNFRYLMKVPEPPAHAANFGSSVHKTLNEFYLLMKNGEKPSLELLERLYQKNWIPYGYDSKDHEKTRKDRGWEILKNYFEKNSKPWVVPMYLEQPFNLKIGDFWVTGRIDRIDRLEDGGLEVIDYKTGAMRDQKDLNKDLQLSLYALACRDILKIKAAKLTLYFLEDNQKLLTGRTDEQLAELEAEVLETIKEIQNSKFAPTPGFHCQFCDFRMICPAV